MSSVRRFVRRLGQFIGAGRGERELAREVDAHLSLLEQEYSAAASRRTKRAAPPFGRSGTWNPPKSSSATRGPSRGWKIFAATSRTGSRALARTPCFTAVAVITLLVIGALACWVPARRAVRVEPMVALRHE